MILAQRILAISFLDKDLFSPVNSPLLSLTHLFFQIEELLVVG